MQKNGTFSEMRPFYWLGKECKHQIMVNVVRLLFWLEINESCHLTIIILLALIYGFQCWEFKLRGGGHCGVVGERTDPYLSE